MRTLIALLLLVVPVGQALASPDWGVRRDPFDRAVIARYRQLLERDPHDPILTQLVALYRRYRTVDELRNSYAGEDWATLVVRARLELGHDDTVARDLLIRATALRDEDARSWIALAALHRAKSPNEARTAYRKALAALQPAVASAITPPTIRPVPASIATAVPARDRSRVLAVRAALADLAILAGDSDEADHHLRALIALDPTPARWLAHGDAMLSTQPGHALVSFREVETRTRDPLQRIDAIARQAAAHAKLGDHAVAIAELRRALAIAPRGTGLAADLVQRIVELARAGNRVGEELAAFEVAWPAPRRGAFEHVMLGHLAEAAGNPSRAVAEFEAAIAAAPREPLAYRHLVGVLERQGRPVEAIAKFEVMAKMFPKDAGVQLDLARRYGLARETEAFATLEALARAVPRDAGVQVAIADVYVAWRRPARAAAAYERAVKLDPSYRSSLAMAYAAAGDRDALVGLARSAGRDAARLGEIATMMLEHAMWVDASATFSDGIAIDPKRATLWSGRAGAAEGLEQWTNAVEDAFRALALTTTTDEKTRKAMRHIVVRDVLRTAEPEHYWRAWRTQLAREPQHRDLPALLEELDGSDVDGLGIHKISGEIRLPHLSALHVEFPDDVLVTNELIAAYVSESMYTEALATVTSLAKVPGQQARAIALRKKIQKDAAAYATDMAWRIAAMREGLLVDVAPRKDAASQLIRIGFRAALGTGDDTRLLRLGAIATLQLDGGLGLVGRVDWTEATTSGGDHVRGAGGSAGLVTRLGTTPNALWSAGGAARVEVRSGAPTPVAVAGEVGIDLTSRFAPFGLGFRLGRYLGGGTVANLELVVEWR